MEIEAMSVYCGLPSSVSVTAEKALNMPPDYIQKHSVELPVTWDINIWIQIKD